VHFITGVKEHAISIAPIIVQVIAPITVQGAKHRHSQCIRLSWRYALIISTMPFNIRVMKTTVLKSTSC
jgi:hypothetical protein